MIPHDVMQRVRALHVFRHLPLGDLDRLLSDADLHGYAPGTPLLEAGASAEHVHVVLSGRVGLRAPLRAGEECLLAVAHKGDWVGDAAALHRAPALLAARAEEPVESLRLDAARLRAWIDATPQLGDWLRSLAARSRQREQALLRLLRDKPPAAAVAPAAAGCTVPAPAPESGEPEAGAGAFIGQSPAARATRQAILRAAACALPVLLVGETGSGKELVARAVHAESTRCQGPFVAVNCGALQETLLESELFGHERGAFTGAIRSKSGLVKAASGGTLFLDEIEEMSPRLQAALLRFLEDGEYRPVGATGSARSDARVVAACQSPPERPRPDGTRSGLRADLLYRLDVVRIALPALRSRPEDIGPLVRDLSARVARRLGTQPLTPTPDALRCLEVGEWPGNVRELRNEVERWYASDAPDGRIEPRHLSIRGPAFDAGALCPTGYGGAVRAFKARLVRQALLAAGGNKSRAAQALGLHRSNLSRLVRDLGVE